MVIFFAAQVAFGAADAAAVLGVAAPPPPPPHEATRIARPRPIDPTARACIFELPLILQPLAKAPSAPHAIQRNPSSGAPSSARPGPAPAAGQHEQGPGPT